MKNFFALTAAAAFSIFCLLGCGSSSDEPSFSDDELLNRGKAGRQMGTQQNAQPPASTSGQATTGN